MGDVPYNQTEEYLLQGVIERMNREDLAFVLHAGDIKNGREPCTEQLFERRKSILQRSHHALVLVPGDNEWTDCRRPQAGGYDPLERLEALRRIFFSGDMSLGQAPMRLQRQSALDPRYSEYRENVRWTAHGIVFVGLNVPGGNNNIGMHDEYLRRSDADIAWLDEAAALAAKPEAKALVVLMQANLYIWNRFRRAADVPDGYAALREALERHTLRLKKPVLLVHGDTHMYSVDHPLRDPASGKRVETFTRVEVFGSPVVNWIKVTALAGGAGGFRIQPGPADNF